MTTLTAKPGLMNIKLYKGGASQLANVSEVLKLSSNENPLGPPPSALSAISSIAPDLHRYPSTDHEELRQALGTKWGLEPDRIICGAGSDEVLQFAIGALCSAGDEVIYTEHGFSMYLILAQMFGATPICVAEKNRRVDVDVILGAVTERSRVVFVANPANPTGTMLEPEELERLVHGLPSSVLLVLDGAYTEYAPDYDGGAQYAKQYPNVLMTRTFSKIYGLGGLRVGWGYAAPGLIDMMNRMRQPFNLSLLQLGVATAALSEPGWAENCQSLNNAERERLTQVLRALGLECDDSQANFVLARAADEAQADEIDLHLKSSGIIIRRVPGYGFPEGLRMTVGDHEQNTRLIAALESWRRGQ